MVFLLDVPLFPAMLFISSVLMRMWVAGGVFFGAGPVFLGFCFILSAQVPPTRS